MADSRPRRSQITLALGVGLVIYACVMALRLSGQLQGIELSLYDRQLRHAAAAELEEPPVTLVLIAEEDLRRFGYPIRDDTLTELLELLLAAKPSAIGIDLYRDLPVPPPATGDPLGDTESYRALGRLVSAHPDIVMAMKFADPDHAGTLPPGFMTPDQVSQQVGATDLPIDRDGVVRRGIVYIDDSESTLMSLAFQVARRHLWRAGIAPETDAIEPERIQLGAAILSPLPASWGPYVSADNRGYQFALDFRWGNRPLIELSLGEVLDGQFEPSALRDRIVLVGIGAASVPDFVQTPISQAPDARGTAYGVAVHAQAAHQLIRLARGESQLLLSGSSWAIAGWIALASLCGVLTGALTRGLGSQLVGLVAPLAVLWLVAFRSALAGWWLPTAAPALSFFACAIVLMAARAAGERAERRQLANLFSRFQGPRVANEIWERRADFMDEHGRPLSRRVVLTALMSDLEGYTAASEKMDPDALMAWANEYMKTMAQLVDDCGGVVDDYAGDGIKANFGFPVPSTTDAEINRDAEAAVRCALEMGKSMEALNQSWSERGLPTGRCRVGILTGDAVVGCIGGDRSLKYTSVGDTINTAARLEGFAKDEFKAEIDATCWRILIGEETLKRTEGRFQTRAIGAHSLKGKEQPVPIYRVEGLAPSDEAN